MLFRSPVRRAPANKEKNREIRSIVKTQGVFFEEEKEKIEWHMMEKDAYYKAKLLRGRKETNLSDEGIRKILKENGIEPPEGEGRGRLIERVNSLARAHAEEAKAQVFADAHDIAVIMAHARGDAVNEKAFEEISLRSPKKEYETPLEEWVAIKRFGNTIDKIDLTWLKENWQLYGPEEEYEKITKYDKPIVRADGTVLTETKTMATRKRALPETEEGVRDAYREYVEDIVQIYKETLGRVGERGTLVHYRRAQEALQAGIKLPDEVVKHYPDLKAENGKIKEKNTFYQDHGPTTGWLESVREDVRQEGRDKHGVPWMKKITGYYRKPVTLPVGILSRLPGEHEEHKYPREESLRVIKKVMEETGKLPVSGEEEYVPYIEVAYDGSAWISEGNHRIFAARDLGWKELPVEIRYFDGGDMAPGDLSPDVVTKYCGGPEWMGVGKMTEEVRTCQVVGFGIGGHYEVYGEMSRLSGYSKPENWKIGRAHV